MQLRISPCPLLFTIAVLFSGCDSDSTLGEVGDADTGVDLGEQTIMILDDISLDYDDAVLTLFNQDAGGSRAPWLRKTTTQEASSIGIECV